ncbi:SMP-30/gluconolactonase/LRE family protein [Streptomyces sp. NL15-2K]|uniref:SMP-30/gluconolactonase/LRE family protein n=1 Tax=Streptomyces sp. NL15-2K TaxID=376149 RepID=UPI000F589E2F|nr:MULTISPECIES: SMP-30/gluconolactonase/LRE family protein [Actinomycetes]WKX14368.1 SMP-30/gluconolactonase/LRE family protein [Kutzneria buriramensis]GCB44568.1 gluconolactonase [Streptomyces sp. NL15-2K]
MPPTHPHPHPTRRAVLGGASLAALAVTVGVGTTSATPNATWPTEFPLPNGWLPEGIAIGAKPYAYLGSRANGAVYRTDLRTGEGKVLFAGGTGLISVGLKVDDREGLLYVAGNTGVARVHDARTGELLVTHQLSEATGHFINDVTLLGGRAWFTDSRAAALYAVPRGGKEGAIRTLPLTGDWTQLPDVNNANGIVDTPDGRGLIVVKSTPGELYNVNVKTGYATKIKLVGQDTVVNGDGLWRIGRTLYVVQNRLNLISVWDLDQQVTTATLRKTISDPRFDVPTTAARFGDRLYLVNARFTTTPTPETTYNAVAVSL